MRQIKGDGDAGHAIGREPLIGEPIKRERESARGELGVKLCDSRLELGAFDGDSIKKLEAPDPIVFRTTDPAGNLIGFTANRLRYGLKLQSYISALSVTYGALDDVDVNVLVPVIQTNLDVGVHSQQVAIAGSDGDFGRSMLAPLSGSTHGTAVGVGDIQLRLKYRLSNTGPIRSAAGLQLRLPAGDENDFLGTGSFEASPFLYASTLLWSRQARYGLGVDVDVTRRIGVVLAFLGRSEFEPSADEINVPHLTPSGPALRPLLGIDFGRKDFADLSFGTRAIVWRDIMFFANGIFALNDDGLRNDTVIPTVGLEGTF